MVDFGSSDDVEVACYTAQSEELEVLRSMYNSSELLFSSSSDSNLKLPSSFTLRLILSDVLVEVSFQLPLKYPLVDYPTVFVRTSGYWDDKQCNLSLRAWLLSRDKGQAMIQDIIWWIQDHGRTMTIATNVCDHMDKLEIDHKKPDIQYSRYFILSHHLFSNIKRANIIKLAKDLGLSGFSTPGKPAVIVIEGSATACIAFWTDVKCWHWQRINIRHTDSFTDPEMLRFKGFRELVLASSDNKHVQTGEVKTILTDLGMGEIFPILYNL